MKTVLFKQVALLLSGAALLASCAKSDIEPDVPQTDNGVAITAKAYAFTEPQTRMGYHEGSSMTFTWEDNNSAKERFSVFAAGSSTPVTFTQTDTGGSRNGTFSGTVATNSGDNLYALYPELAAGGTYTPTAVSLDLSKQVLATSAEALKHNKSHYMWAKATYEGSSTVDFTFEHKIAILKVEMTLPTGANAIKQVKLAGFKAKANLDVTSGAIDFSGITEQESIMVGASSISLTDNKLTAYIFVFEQDATGKTLELIATDADDVSYGVKFTGRAIVAGKVYILHKSLTFEPGRVESWEGNTNDVISKEIKPGFTANDLKFGDYYYSDGTWSDGGYRECTDNSTMLLPIMPVLTDAAGKARTVIGIVYWAGDATAKDKTLKADHPGCTHGLAISLSGNEQNPWQLVMTNTSVQFWLDTNKKDEFLPVTALLDTYWLNNIQGYNNTKAIEVYNAAATEENLVHAIQHTVEYRAKVPAPLTSSNWYLPSIKELALLCGKEVNDVYRDKLDTTNRDLINSKMSLIGGMGLNMGGLSYWGSTEFGGFAYSLNFADDTGNEKRVLNQTSKRYYYRVRCVLAF